MELHSFDDSYLERLRAGDDAVQHHFISYFSDLLRVKLRARFLPPDLIDDVRQETFARVLVAVRRPDAIRSAERLGAFVNSVCNHVLLEEYRSSGRHEALENHPEPADRTIDMEGALVSDQTCRQVKDVLAQLPARDRELLRAIFLEEKDKDQVCRDFGVDRGYLRVLLHRAKSQFRARYVAKLAALANKS